MIINMSRKISYIYYLMITLDIINAFTYKCTILYFFLKSAPQTNFIRNPSLGPNLYIQSISPSQLYLSNFESNLIYDIYQGTFWVPISSSLGSYMPKLLFSDHGIR